MSGVRKLTNRSDLEAQVGRAMIHFEKEFMGRGPLETRAYLLDDLILVRLKGVLTPAEKKLAESQSDRSAYLLKQVRNELLASGRPLLEAVIADIVGVPVQSIHTDISTRTGERVLVFTLQQRPRFDGSTTERIDDVDFALNQPGQENGVIPMQFTQDDVRHRDEQKRSASS